jgi:hypothetical protein
LALLALVAVLAGAGGFAAGWFGRGAAPAAAPVAAPQADLGVQEGVFSYVGEEELKIHFPHPYVSVPNLQVGESSEYVTVTEVQPSYFKVKGKPGTSATNCSWKARGSLAK